MVFGVETYRPPSDGRSAARIEEEVVIGENDMEIITRFPSEELFVVANQTRIHRMNKQTYSTNIKNVEAVPGLGPQDGWIGMTVQFLIDRINGGSQHIVFGRARFAPGRSEHQMHRHPGAEEFVLVTNGEGIVFDGPNRIPVKVGDIVFHAQGEWHGFLNTSDTKEAELIWGWGGAASKADAGYELQDEHSS